MFDFYHILQNGIKKKKIYLKKFKIFALFTAKVGILKSC